MDADLTAAQHSLLRATQLIHVAAQRAETQAARGLDDLEAVLLLGAVRTLGWQAMVLLPEGLPLIGAVPSGVGCLAALEEAEQELRARPIWEYPVGTSALVVALCDAIATTRAGAWL